VGTLLGLTHPGVQNLVVHNPFFPGADFSIHYFWIMNAHPQEATSGYN